MKGMFATNIDCIESCAYWNLTWLSESLGLEKGIIKNHVEFLCEQMPL